MIGIHRNARGLAIGDRIKLSTKRDVDRYGAPAELGERGRRWMEADYALPAVAGRMLSMYESARAE